MNVKFVHRLQGMFDSHYKEVRNIYQMNGNSYAVVVWNKYIGSFTSLKSALYARDLNIYINKLHKSRLQGKGWDKHVMVPAYSKSFYEDMAKKKRLKNIRNLYDAIIKGRNTEIGRPKTKRVKP